MDLVYFLLAENDVFLLSGLQTLPLNFLKWSMIFLTGNPVQFDFYTIRVLNILHDLYVIWNFFGGTPDIDSEL